MIALARLALELRFHRAAPCLASVMLACSGAPRRVPAPLPVAVEVPPPPQQAFDDEETLLDSLPAAVAPSLVIDDCEDDDNQILVHEGRGGYWYTYGDETGTTLSPTAGSRGGIVHMSAPGHAGSAHAMRFWGHSGSGSIVYAGAGLNFTDPRAAYNAAEYAGIRFWARRGSPSTPPVRVKIPDVNTAPDGGICSECFNDFGTTIELSDQWHEHVLPFAEMRQVDGWGQPRPEAIDGEQLFSILFEVSTPSAAFDVWIDDVAFLVAGG